MHRTRRACPRAQVYTPLCLAHVHSAKRNESGSSPSILTVALLVASNHCRMEAFLGCEVNVHVSGSDEIKLKKCTWKHSTSGALSLNGWRQTQCFQAQCFVLGYCERRLLTVKTRVDVLRLIHIHLSPIYFEVRCTALLILLKRTRYLESNQQIRLIMK